MDAEQVIELWKAQGQSERTTHVDALTQAHDIIQRLGCERGEAQAKLLAANLLCNEHVHIDMLEAMNERAETAEAALAEERAKRKKAEWGWNVCSREARVLQGAEERAETAEAALAEAKACIENGRVAHNDDRVARDTLARENARLQAEHRDCGTRWDNDVTALATERNVYLDRAVTAEARVAELEQSRAMWEARCYEFETELAKMNEIAKSWFPGR